MDLWSNVLTVMLCADHSLFINCGGSETNFEGNEYEDNASTDGPSLYEYHTRWAFSSTGRYVGEDSAPFIVRNDSTMITSDAQIYQTARLAPSSLNFYGLCMRSGSYKVRLHFAEIVFYDNATYNSLGRRVFDVAIQVSEFVCLHGLYIIIFTPYKLMNF